MADTVKDVVATAVRRAVREAIDRQAFTSWPATVEDVSALQFSVWVRPQDGQPRRMFIVQVKEVL